MKKFLFLIGLTVFLPALIVWAQGGHYNHVFWTPPADATSTTTYSVFAATGACPATGVPAGSTQVTSGVTASSYDDHNVTVGQTKCYYVVAVTNGAHSVPSNTAPATTPASAPTGCGASAN